MQITRTGLVSFVLLFSCLSPDIKAQAVETGFLDRTVFVDGAEYGYQTYVPKDYALNDKWPVILFLHGLGERGADGLAQTEVGLGRAVRLNSTAYPAVIVFPQTPTIWQDLGSEIALAALDSTLAEFKTDASRVYLTGLSMGGNGSWYLARNNPGRFAAVVVVSGFVQGLNELEIPPISSNATGDRYSDVASHIKGIPIWIFHGDSDPVVPVTEAQRMNTALQIVGADVRYSEFYEVGHNAWDPAYSFEELPRWLFAQRR